MPLSSPAFPRRPIWHDRWLLDAFRRASHPLVEACYGSMAPSAWVALEEAGVMPDEVLATASSASGAPIADLSGIGPNDARLLDRPLALRYGVVPLGVVEGALRMACANPLAPSLEQELAFASARRVTLFVASPAAVAEAQAKVYGSAPAPSAKPPGSARLAWHVQTVRDQPLSAPLRGEAVDVLNRIIVDAFDQGASDVHFEPQDLDLLVRFRVDGVLNDVMRVPGELAPQLVSRLKVQAGLDIADRMRPQDGRASANFDGRQIDLRISSLPLGNKAEKIVVRVLDSGVSTIGLGALGFTPGEKYRLEKLLSGTQGMVLLTGPTGSGKTTTLYSALRHLQTGRTNIVTVEDPIEYRLEGVNQVQVHEKAGLTFAAALRSILRQDPDVVLIGEIRDAETSSIAIKAAMTGHLVLSTLHTNDAPSAVERLADIGAEMGALSGALRGVVAQRLVRKLCASCSQPVPLAELPMDQQMLLMGKKTDRLRKPVGCPACRDIGYRGRMVVAEVMVVTPDMQRAIARGADVGELTVLARRSGMHTLWEAGIERVLAGSTSLHELLDNVGAPVLETQADDGDQNDVDALLAKLMQPAGAATVAAGARPPAAIAVRRNASGPRVLVVDDDRDARRLLRTTLEQEGYRVFECADGEAALAYARRLVPDAVVTELALPRLDGVGLVQALVDGGLAPAVVFTEQDDLALLDWARDVGALEVLERRGGTAALMAVLRQIAVSIATVAEVGAEPAA